MKKRKISRQSGGNLRFQESAIILKKKIQGNFLYFTLKTKEIAKNSRPGQFINIRVTEDYVPFLRRPFSISDVEGDLIKLLIQIKGRGTRLLSEKQEGESLNIIGPLGNSFPLNVKNPLIVAGGIGIAPFPFLARQFSDITLLYGVKTKELLPDLSIFPENTKILLVSEDGSTGKKGTVVDLLIEYGIENKTIFACGPNPLFKALNKIFFACKNEVVAYYSLEAYMACGFGVCKGCSVYTSNGYRLVCKDGPVFFWNEVRL
jgi:dihydroorotate dehydrogenase electron transfer subunit